MKLEYVCNRGIFLPQKVYALNTIENKQNIKIKGLSKDVSDLLTLDEVEKLLFKNKKLEIALDKWYYHSLFIFLFFFYNICNIYLFFFNNSFLFKLKGLNLTNYFYIL